MKYFEGFVAENDGYGIVGYSFICPYCDHFTRFVDEEDDGQVCESCGEVSMHIKFEPENILQRT